MLRYDLGGVEAFSTGIGEEAGLDVVLPLHQAHGVRSAIVTPGITEDNLTGVDALITRERGRRIGVKTADCVPVLLHDTSTGTVAAVHSGWRGTVAGICEVVIRRMSAELGCYAGSMKAVIGPCIHVDAFEVGDEVKAEFDAAGYGDWCRRMLRWDGTGPEKWHVDLPGVVRRQLLDAGIGDENIVVRDECTFMCHDRFYSARRLGPDFSTQRIISAVMLP